MAILRKGSVQPYVYFHMQNSEIFGMKYTLEIDCFPIALQSMILNVSGRKKLDPVTNIKPLSFCVTHFSTGILSERSLPTFLTFPFLHPRQPLPLTPSIWHLFLSAALPICFSFSSTLLYSCAPGICFHQVPTFSVLLPLCKMY